MPDHHSFCSVPVVFVYILCKYLGSIIMRIVQLTRTLCMLHWLYCIAGKFSQKAGFHRFCSLNVADARDHACYTQYGCAYIVYFPLLWYTQ